MFDNGDLLIALKRRRAATGTGTAAAAGTFSFQLFSEGRTAYLRTIDAKGNALLPDHRACSGPARSLLKALAAERDLVSASIGWGDEGELLDALPVSGRSDLMELLLRCDNIVDKQLQPIATESATIPTMVLHLIRDAEAKVWQGLLQLRQPNGVTTAIAPDAVIPADGFLLADGLLRRCAPVGTSASLLPAFAQRFPEHNLAAFLSLFVSAFPSTAVSMDGYSIRTGEPLAAQTAVLFEEVDEDACLHLSLTECVDSLPVDFVRDYDIASVAIIDHHAHTVLLRPIDYATAIQTRDNIRQNLAKLNRSRKAADAFMVDEGDDTFMLSEELAAEFLRVQLPEIASNVRLFGTERLGTYRVVHAQPKLSLRLSHGIDFLDGDASLEIEGESFGLMDALAMYQKSRYITLADGRNAVVDPEVMARLERLFRKHKKGVRVSFFDLPLIEELMDAASSSADFPDARALFSGFNDLPSRRVQLRHFKGDLRPYQLAGLKWLDYLHEHKVGGCLADDMGLGKTVQTIALLSRIKIPATKPVLIVMPRSLLYNWARELEQFAPQLPFHIHYGSGRDWQQACQSSVILTTYGTLRSEIESIASKRFSAVILDESQAIKNADSQISRAVCTLKAAFRLALSGTPVENHLGELYALFRFLNPAMFHSAADFERTYARPIQQSNDLAAASDLRKRVFPFILRRLKADVLTDLPPKIEQVLYVEMTAEQKEYYERRRRFHQTIVANEVAANGVSGSRFMILEAMLELRQIASVPEARSEGAIVSAKRERLQEAISEAVENGHKCLVFCNFLAGVEAVCEDLVSAGIGHERMTGSTVDRQTRVERFQSDPATKVFVMTLKTGGLGLNLTAADTVFIMDPWWNTSAEAQAVDRAHRIGQTSSVFTYRLIARDSIEEKIRLLQQKKTELVDKVLTSDEGAFKSLDAEDIAMLFNS
jgi:superfamily II DNA or RNA helicase